MRLPSHKYFIDKFLDWELVEYRLSKYKNINSHYDLKLFQECSSKSPYYCHYLAWRLGTWKNESIFEFIDHLFEIASSLPNWRTEKHLLRSQEYSVFWSLVWQMQVASFFYERKKYNVEWFNQSSGPDIKITQRNLIFFIECYNFTKSFGIENLISDIFTQLNPKIKVEHQLFLRHSLPKSNPELESFLNEIFRPYLDESFLYNKEQEAEKEYPILLPVPEKVNNFYIYLEGNDPDKYIPGKKPMGAGDPSAYLDQMVGEALKNKMNSNKLNEHHPNILAINFLIGADLQNILRHDIHTPSFRIPNEYFQVFDYVVFEACGIDEIPNINTYFTSIGTKNNIS